MFRLCSRFPLLDLLAGSTILMLGTMALVQWKSWQRNAQMDGNERLLLQFTIFAIFTILIFLFLVFAEKLC